MCGILYFLPTQHSVYWKSCFHPSRRMIFSIKQWNSCSPPSQNSFLLCLLWKHLIHLWNYHLIEEEDLIQCLRFAYFRYLGLSSQVMPTSDPESSFSSFWKPSLLGAIHFPAYLKTVNWQKYRNYFLSLVSFLRSGLNLQLNITRALSWCPFSSALMDFHLFKFSLEPTEVLRLPFAHWHDWATIMFCCVSTSPVIISLTITYLLNRHIWKK